MPAVPAVPAAAVLNPSLRTELLERMRVDQQVRREMDSAIRVMGDPQRIDPVTVRRWQMVDRENTAWLQPIIRLLGWPGYRLVGEDGAQAAWILVQHADHDRDFQRRMVTVMGEAVARGDASPVDHAYLVNRLRRADGLPPLPIPRPVPAAARDSAPSSAGARAAPPAPRAPPA